MVSVMVRSRVLSSLCVRVRALGLRRELMMAYQTVKSSKREMMSYIHRESQTRSCRRRWDPCR